MSVAFALILVAGNVSSSRPTWPERREFRLGVEGGDTTGGGGGPVLVEVLAFVIDNGGGTSFSSALCLSFVAASFSF